MASQVPDTGQGAEELIRRRHAEAFEQGRQNAQQQLRSELDESLGKLRDEMREVLRAFAGERHDYYRRGGTEIVQLALGIAPKKLHREVQIDPQALAGIVRITLEKLDNGTKVSLGANPKEAAEWRHYFACQPTDVPPPEIFEDPAIPAGQCRIEPSLGSTEIGLQLQLKEMETGLLALLAERPGGSGSLEAAPPMAEKLAEIPSAGSGR